MIPASRLHRSAPSSPLAYPAAAEPFEEVGACAPADAAAALAFALARLVAARSEERPVALVTTADWSAERGRPFAGGLGAWWLNPGRLIYPLVQPLVLLVLFISVFGNLAISRHAGAGAYRQFLVPGIMVQNAALTAPIATFPARR